MALFIGMLVGYYVSPLGNHQSRINELENQMTILQSQVDSLQEQVISKDARIEELELLNADLIKKLNLTVLGVYFSPHGGCGDQVVNWVDRANKTVYVLIYSFTNDDIGDAVVRAYQRGVEVKVVFEKSQVSKYSEYWKLQPLGTLVRNDTNSKLMHHKTAVIDGYILLTGSFNWSAAAEESNNENLMILQSEYLAVIFEEEFQKIWDTAQ